eukprot:jgi/Chrzof1/6569/Cz19g01120.t1
MYAVIAAVSCGCCPSMSYAPAAYDFHWQDMQAGMANCKHGYNRTGNGSGSSLICKYVASRHNMDAPGNVEHWQLIDGSIVEPPRTR